MNDPNSPEKKLTDFGYTQVTPQEKTRKVAEVFHSVANKYDVMNDLMSLGIHRIWKRFAIDQAGVRPGHHVLDIAGGSGDLSKQFAKLVGNKGYVVLADINSSMLEVGRQKLTNAGIVGNIEYVQANAECLPFAAENFDCVTIAFGLRNVTDKAAALRSMYHVLKPGGKLLILEFSAPKSSFLKSIYDKYSFSLLPRLGKLVAGDEDSYRYLAESIRKHPDQEALKSMVLAAGFSECYYHNLTGGIVALHCAIKTI